MSPTAIARPSLKEISLDNSASIHGATNRTETQATLTPEPSIQDPAPAQDPQKGAVDATLKKVADIMANKSLSPQQQIEAINRLTAGTETKSVPAATPAPTASAPAPSTATAEKPEIKPAPGRLGALDGLPSAAQPKPATASPQPSSPTPEPTSRLDALRGLSGIPGISGSVDLGKVTRGENPIKLDVPPVTSKPAAPEATVPAAEPKPAPAAPSAVAVKPSAAPAGPRATPETQTSLSPELEAEALRRGNELARALYGRNISACKTAALDVRSDINSDASIDRDSRAAFKEAVARGYAEQGIKLHEKALAERGAHGVDRGADIEQAMRYEVMANILKIDNSRGNFGAANKRAGEILKESASKRITELTTSDTSASRGAEDIRTAQGLAQRFDVKQPSSERLADVRAAMKTDALNRIDTLLKNDLSTAEKVDEIKGILKKANAGKTTVTDGDVAALVSEHINRSLKERGETAEHRAAIRQELIGLADGLGIESSTDIKALLTETSKSAGRDLLNAGIPAAIADTSRSTDQMIADVKELRREAIELGIDKKEVDTVITTELLKEFEREKVSSLEHAKRMNDYADRLGRDLALPNESVETLKASIRNDILPRLDEILAEQKEQIEAIARDSQQKGLDRIENDMTAVAEKAAAIGDDKLARDIKVVLGLHAIDEIMALEKGTLAERADEAEDMVDDLAIAPEAAQKIAAYAAKSFTGGETVEEIKNNRAAIQALQEEFYLRARDINKDTVLERRDAHERLEEMKRGLETRQREAEEKAAKAALEREAQRIERVYGEIKTLLNQDKPSADDRIRQIKKLQLDNALDKGRIKTLVEERIESLGSKGAKGAREITKLADNFDVSLE